MAYGNVSNVILATPQGPEGGDEVIRGASSRSLWTCQCPWSWELRLQDEIGPDFVIEETDHEIYRRQYLTNNTKDAIDAVYKEVLRREKKETGVYEIVLNRSGLWSVASQEMWEMEDTIAEKLYDIREKIRKKEKGKIAVKKVSFKIQSPDRDEEVQKLIKEKPNLQQNRNNKYESTEQIQGSLF